MTGIRCFMLMLSVYAKKVTPSKTKIVSYKVCNSKEKMNNLIKKLSGEMKQFSFVEQVVDSIEGSLSRSSRKRTLRQYRLILPMLSLSY